MLKKPLDRLACRPAELAAMLTLPGWSTTARDITNRCAMRSCAYIRPTLRCVLILDGDWQDLMPGGREHRAQPDDTGREVVARFFRDRDRINFREIGYVLGVTHRSVHGWAVSGVVPYDEDRRGRFMTPESFRQWVLDMRVPTRWEIMQ